MANTIDTAFIEEFDSAVKLAYQQEGSLLRGTCRTKTGVRASARNFQLLGKGEATEKGRNGMIPPMQPEHTTVAYTLVDKYAADYVDMLDELKINIAEKEALKRTAVAALGRAADKQIIEVLDTGSVYAGEATDGFTKEKFKTALKTLLKNDVKNDGDITCVLGWDQWYELLEIDQFANADYVSYKDLPWLGKTQGRRWQNVLFIAHNDLTVASSVRKCHMYHSTGIGHGTGQDIVTSIDPIPEKDSWFVKAKMSMGACLIDTEGLVTLRCKEAA